MISNRKNTSKVVSSWKNYLNKKTLNESSYNARERNELFEAIISDLLECDWEENRVDTLVDVLQRCNPSDDELEMIAYGDTDNYDLNNDKDLSDNEGMSI